MDPSSECVVCGSRDLSPTNVPTSRSETPVGTKLREVLLDTWVTTRDETAVCCACFHLVDRFDILEGQLETIRRDLTEKYVSQTGDGRKNVAMKKRRPYTRRKKQTLEDPDGYVPPDNVMPDQQLVHVDNVAYRVDLGTVWSGGSTVGWKEDEVKSPRAIYDRDPHWLNPGEQLRVGVETDLATFACVHCDRVAPSEECLNRHVRVDHLPTFLTAPVPIELGLGAALNCGVQLSNVRTEKPFACIFCDAAFKFKSNLSVHFKEKHTPHKPFSCVDCSDSFRRSMELSRHKVYYCPHRKKNLPRKEKKTK